MAKVKMHNGDENATAEGFTKYYFSGTPPEQFEHRAEVGEQRVMSVTVECKHSGDDLTDKGVQHQTKWKVINAEIGTMHKRAGTKDDDDPDQPSLLDIKPGGDGGEATPVDPADFKDGPSFSASE